MIWTWMTNCECTPDASYPAERTEHQARRVVLQRVAKQRLDGREMGTRSMLRYGIFFLIFSHCHTFTSNRLPFHLPFTVGQFAIDIPRISIPPPTRLWYGPDSALSRACPFVFVSINSKYNIVTNIPQLTATGDTA